MKKIILCLFILLIIILDAWSQRNNSFSEFDNYLLKNYSLPESLKSDCNFNYVALLLKTDSRGSITKIEYLNDAHPDLKKSFDYLKKFRFKASSKINSRPILLFGTIDQRNYKLCPVLYPYDASPSKVLREVADIIKNQLMKDPRTIVLGTFSAESPAPPIP